MKTFHVKISVRTLEIWRVEAKNENEAMLTWDEGDLIHSSDETLTTEILSVKER